MPFDRHDRSRVGEMCGGGGGPKGGNHAAVAVRNQVYFLGESGTGVSDVNQIEVHIFNAVSLRWIKLPPVPNRRGRRPVEVPPRCYDHTAVLVEDAIYVWGGFVCGDRNNVWQYSDVLYAFDVHTHRWSRPGVSGTPPTERRDHSACALGTAMYVYGGYTQRRYTNVVYRLDTTAMAWSAVKTSGTPPPPSLQGHTATVIGTRVFVFGGYGDESYSNAVRVFDTDTDRWLSTTTTTSSSSSAHFSPEGRWGHSSFAHNGELYIFGGCDWDRTFNDLWRFDPETFSWRRVEVKGKGPSRMYYMCCCMVGDRMVLFGGYKVSGQGHKSIPADNLFILDLSPSLKTLCKLAVNGYNLRLSGLPHNIRSELVAMTKKTRPRPREAKAREPPEILFCRRKVLSLAHPAQNSAWLNILKLKMERKIGRYVDIGIHLEKRPL